MYISITYCSTARQYPQTSGVFHVSAFAKKLQCQPNYFYFCFTQRQLATLRKLTLRAVLSIRDPRENNPKKEEMKTPANFEKGPLDKTPYLTVTGIFNLRFRQSAAQESKLLPPHHTTANCDLSAQAR